MGPPGRTGQRGVSIDPRLEDSVIPLRASARIALCATALLLAGACGPDGRASGQDAAPRTTRTAHAARWAARVTPFTAVGLGALTAVAFDALCETDPCTGRLEGFVGGAMIGTALGAGLGALLGVVSYGPGTEAGPVSPVPNDGVRWEIHAGSASAAEGLGYRSCGVPQSKTQLRARVGGAVRPRTDAFAEATLLRFEDDGCEGQGLPTNPRLVAQTARSASVLAGLSRALDDRRRVLVDAAVDVARLTLWTDGVASVGSSEESKLGLHLAAGARAGWTPELGDGVRMGVALRGDWILSSPMGSVPVVTLSLGLWR